MIIKRPIATEKAIKLIEAENKIIFEVSDVSKEEVRAAVEKEFNVKVEKVNTLRKGAKKIAIVKLRPDTPAIDIATKLGMI